MIGQTLGHYRILEKIGAGGMGEVYRARDERLDRDVALKVLPAGTLADEAARKRFRKEALALSKLNHPNIATIHDFDTQDGVDFLVMEHIPGVTLSEKLAGGPLPEKEALGLGAQLAEGLAAAHEQGIIHRDLKPGNLRVTRDGRLKILDFGVAKLLGPVSETATMETLTGTQTVAGTPLYMSPEQRRGQRVDARTDLYSAGLVLLEVLTGKPPSVAGRGLAGKASPDLQRIVEKCLEEDPENRYQSAKELLAEFGQLGQPPATSHLESRPWRRRARPWVTLGLALMFLFALGVLQEPFLRWIGFARLPEEKILVVLPFRAIGGEFNDQAYCDGLTETLTSQLGRIPYLQLAASNEVRAQKVDSVDAARKKLGANLIMTATWQRSGERVRVNLSLVEAASGRQLRSETVDAQVADLFTVQDRVVTTALEMLGVELHPSQVRELANPGTAVPSAYDFYLRGQGYLRRFEKVQNLDSAIHLFEKALEKDHVYALAYAGLGEAYLRKSFFDPRPEWIAEAEKNSRRAIELGEHLAPVHVTLGLVYQNAGKYKDALAEFKRALQLDPVNPDAYRGLARTHEAMGSLEEAETSFQQAIALRSNYWADHQSLGAFYYRRGRYAEAEAQFRRVIELIPENASGYYGLGGLYHLMGRTDEAIAMIRKSLALEPTAYAYSNLGTLYYFQASYSDAVQMFEKATDLAPNDYLVWGNLADAYRWAAGQREKSVPAYQRAIALAREQLLVNPRDAGVLSDVALYHAKLGEGEKALVALTAARREAPTDVNIMFKAAVVNNLANRPERALELVTRAAQSGYSLSEIRSEPELANLRSDPRFQALLRRMNFPD